MSARRPYDPDQDGPLLSAYVDGELDGEHRELVDVWLAEEGPARTEVERLIHLKAFTDHLVLREAPREAWDDFNDGVYNRGERGLGWTLLLVGIAVVGGFLLLRLGMAILVAAIPLVVRVGVVVGAAGALILLISTLRQRLFTRRRDRYDDVKR